MSLSTNHDRPLRRAGREIKDPAAIERIFHDATLLFLALADEPAPYVIPVCFGRVGDTLYVHSAREGRKIEGLQSRPHVGFSASTNIKVKHGERACDFSCAARSVVGTATARIVEDEAERRRGLDAIMRHYAGEGAPTDYRDSSLARTCVIALDLLDVCAKRVGSPDNEVNP